ncbi:hypothetical protein GCM10010176_097640 [Nonomuraea spiralis]|nr:hypothetical protein GCM10010176_097640 [Nonomuraea spiralis]
MVPMNAKASTVTNQSTAPTARYASDIHGQRVNGNRRGELRSAFSVADRYIPGNGTHSGIPGQ